MEFIVVLILVILLVVTLSNSPKNELKNLFTIIEALGKEIRSLRKEIGSLEAKIDDLKTRPQQAHESYDSSIKTALEREPQPAPEEKQAPEIVAEPIEETVEIREEINAIPQAETTTPIEPAVLPEKENAVFIDDYLISRQPAASFSQPQYKKESIQETEKQES